MKKFWLLSLVVCGFLLQSSALLACTGASIPDPLEVAHAYGLDPHPSAVSLTPVEVDDPKPHASGRPRIPRGLYYSVSPHWPTEEEIRFANQCANTAAELFMMSEGRVGSALETALKYARIAQFYGHAQAGHLLREYFGFRRVHVSARKVLIHCAGDCDYPLNEAMHNSMRGYGSGVSHTDSFAANARRLAEEKDLITGSCEEYLSRVFADIFEAERVALEAAARLEAESKEPDASLADPDGVRLGFAGDERKEAEEGERVPFLGGHDVLRHRKSQLQHRLPATDPLS